MAFHGATVLPFGKFVVVTAVGVTLWSKAAL
jgi:hypothetical protein